MTKRTGSPKFSGEWWFRLSKDPDRSTHVCKHAHTNKHTAAACAASHIRGLTGTQQVPDIMEAGWYVTSKGPTGKKVVVR